MATPAELLLELDNIAYENINPDFRTEGDIFGDLITLKTFFPSEQLDGFQNWERKVAQSMGDLHALYSSTQYAADSLASVAAAVNNLRYILESSCSGGDHETQGRHTPSKIFVCQS